MKDKILEEFSFDYQDIELIKKYLTTCLLEYKDPVELSTVSLDQMSKYRVLNKIYGWQMALMSVKNMNDHIQLLINETKNPPTEENK